MAIKFVKVRRVDDHSITAELAEVSLPRWEGVWERIPDGEQAETIRHSPASESPSRTQADLYGDQTTPKTSRSCSSAASTDKE